MARPDFRELNNSIERLAELNQSLLEIIEIEERFGESIKTACQAMMFSRAKESLEKVPVHELSKSKAGIRVSALRDAGFQNLGDVARLSKTELIGVEGIGEKQADAIENILNEFQNHLTGFKSVRISQLDNSPENMALIKAISQYIQGRNLRFQSGTICDSVHSFADDILSQDIARGTFKWLFSGGAKKERTLAVYEDLNVFFGSENYFAALDAVNRYEDILGMPLEWAMEDFGRNSAEYHAVLEYHAGEELPKPLIYSSIPAKLASEIDGIPLNLSGFSGTLRLYQAFGAKYILHQGRVLLGDEMGLGKTIQAIAVMTHIEGERPGSHFLVVCPASVLVNWVREIRRFSSIPVHLVHGKSIDTEFEEWRSLGGVCVTNYESMGKIVGGIDNVMRLALMVIDEAHYIKNPDAKRTKYIHALENESERILLMTGTPLENRVDEMCTLVDFVRPDMSDEVRKAALLSKVPEFREMLAPVYLRRLREDVLSELPPIERKVEWCEMTAADKEGYRNAIAQRNFNEMRRVSFLQDDMLSSSKSMRILELCEEAKQSDRKVIIYSFFRETVDKVSGLLGDDCVGVITGSTDVAMRQSIIDRFFESGTVLVCQIQAGGTGLNIQAASMVIFCEPQIKPSLENQALSRVYRMGQNRNVLVHHLLCPNTIDEAMIEVLSKKQIEFDTFAHESVMGEATEIIFDKEWIRDFIDKQSGYYLELKDDIH